jgi:hypothetical protein
MPGQQSCSLQGGGGDCFKSFNVRIVQSAQQFTLNPNYDQFSKANDAPPLTTIELDSCVLNNQICFPPTLRPFPHPHCCPTQWDNFTASKPCHYSSKSIVTITGQCWIGFRSLLGPFVLENPKLSHSSYFSRFSFGNNLWVCKWPRIQQETRPQLPHFFHIQNSLKPIL